MEQGNVSGGGTGLQRGHALMKYELPRKIRNHLSMVQLAQEADPKLLMDENRFTVMQPIFGQDIERAVRPSQAFCTKRRKQDVAAARMISQGL